MYVLPRLPVYVHGGYRLSRFKTDLVHEGELGGITIGAGVWTNAR